MTDMMQTVVITLADGAKYSFTGPAITQTAAEIDDLKIVEISFTPPRPLPKDCTFQHLTEEETHGPAKD